MTCDDIEVRVTSLLDYPDADVSLDLDAIVRRGYRRRQRRRIAVVAASVTVAGGLTTAGVLGVQADGSTPNPVTVRPATTETVRPLPATASHSDHLLSDHPPVANTTTLATNDDGWRAIAYVDTSNNLCMGWVDGVAHSEGACGAIDTFGNGPAPQGPLGVNDTFAATAPSADAPDPGDIGVFGVVGTGGVEPGWQHVASVTAAAGGRVSAATLSPTAAEMGGAGDPAATNRVWFAWVPVDSANRRVTVVAHDENGAESGAEVIFLRNEAGINNTEK